MSENKTRPDSNSVHAFLDAMHDQVKHNDCMTLLAFFKKTTGEVPIMWGGSMIGFGSYHYRYQSGREGDMLLTGFSLRKQNISIYIRAAFARYVELMKVLRPHKTGKSCLYIKRIADVDLTILTTLIAASFEYYSKKYIIKSN